MFTLVLYYILHSRIFRYHRVLFKNSFQIKIFLYDDINLQRGEDTKRYKLGEIIKFVCNNNSDRKHLNLRFLSKKTLVKKFKDPTS